MARTLSEVHDAEAVRGMTAPPGWRLVPEEPTEAMIEAALVATAAWLDIPGSKLTVNREKARRRYKAMLAAAPQPTVCGPPVPFERI